MLCDDLDGWDEGGRREVQEGGDIRIHIADSFHCTAETNTTLSSNKKYIYKNNFFKCLERNYLKSLLSTHSGYVMH